MSRTAFVFPGQGSQRVGMGGELVERHPEFLDSHYRVADAVLGIPLTELCREGPAAELGAMPVTQPAVFLTSVVAHEVLRAHGVVPDVVAGHSLGEFTAMVAAGVLDWTDGLRLVRLRGELMASVNRRIPGSMGAVIGIAPAELEDLCARAAAGTGEVVEIANHNDHRQIVVSGQTGGVARLLELAEGAGAERVLTLDVGGAAHCSLLSGIEEEFARALEGFELRDPVVPVVSAVTAAPVRTAQEAAVCLRRQFTSRVLWTDTVLALADSGVDRFVEVGPGKALSSLCARLCPGAQVYRTRDAQRLDRVVAALGAAGAHGAGAR
ncbi:MULTISPECIES: ACP S-malonyltransferase [unclassified Streptomyces]|uniref:ACP S-malonyltransferase n=1 Tax=unclassified Streptomyces TaxID=2593676 RepID=UPI00380B35AC